jgi:16S rRNA (adenine1518-N6/adenine1519-N6)-dimethyltransferase
MADPPPPLREVIARHGLDARKKLGQHFLLDANLTGRIVRQAGPLAGRHVIEIGPGPGGLTRALLASEAASVTAIEVDPRAVAAMRELEAEAGGRLRVLEADALRLDLRELTEAPRQIVANLPYNVATPLIVESLDGLPNVRLWCVMVQREVADRLFASPSTKAYGAVSVLVQLVCERTGFHPVSRSVFRPRPNVDSALVAFRRVAMPQDFARVKKVVVAAFAHRRKTLPNSLELAGLASRAAGTSALEAIGRDAATRAEALTPPEFVALAEALR